MLSTEFFMQNSKSGNLGNLSSYIWCMELFSIRIWSCIGPNGNLLCLWQPPKMLATHTLQQSIHIWLLGRSACSSPSTYEFHVLGNLSHSSLPKKIASKRANLGSWQTYPLLGEGHHCKCDQILDYKVAHFFKKWPKK